MEFGKDIFAEIEDIGEYIGYGYGNPRYHSREDEDEEEGEGDEE